MFSNCYLIFFSLRGPFWNSPPDGDGSGNGQYAEVDRISLTASDRIVWQFSEFPTVPDPKNSSFQRPVPRGNFSGAESWFMFAVFALFKIKVSIILKMIHETITYRSRIVKCYVSPEERRYISIYYYYYYYYYYSVPFQSFILRHLVFVPTATTRKYQKNVRDFFPFSSHRPRIDRVADKRTLRCRGSIQVEPTIEIPRNTSDHVVARKGTSGNLLVSRQFLRSVFGPVVQHKLISQWSRSTSNCQWFKLDGISEAHCNKGASARGLLLGYIHGTSSETLLRAYWKMIFLLSQQNFA